MESVDGCREANKLRVRAKYQKTAEASSWVPFRGKRMVGCARTRIYDICSGTVPERSHGVEEWQLVAVIDQLVTVNDLSVSLNRFLSDSVAQFRHEAAMTQ